MAFPSPKEEGFDMPSAHRRIADASRSAWDYATALLLAARTTGAVRADLDALADYADEQRDCWLRADQRARREGYRRRDMADTPAALDFGEPFALPDSCDPEFDMQNFAMPDDVA